MYVSADLSLEHHMRLVAVILVSAIMYPCALDCSPVLILILYLVLGWLAYFLARLASFGLGAPNSTLTLSLSDFNIIDSPSEW